MLNLKHEQKWATIQETPVLRCHYQVGPATAIGDQRGKALEAQLRPWLTTDEVARIDALLEAFQGVSGTVSAATLCT